MIITKRKDGSQRSSRPMKASFFPNFAGQGGVDALVLQSEDTWITIEFETKEEVTQLLSEAHIVFHNYKGT